MSAACERRVATSGPAWFIWVLLLFDLVTALLCTWQPSLAPALGRGIAKVPNKPLGIFFGLLMVSLLTYVPMAAMFSAAAWSGWGPFSFQTSRILLYYAYFLMAVGVGAHGTSNVVLAQGSALARHWFSFSVAAIFALGAALAFAFLGAKVTPHEVWAGTLLAISCACSSLALTGIFLRFMQTPSPLWSSLSANSYGIYMVHYMFVS